ncbi:MAG: hypothetical protein N3E50_05620 [Candidatus Goldbacteria bacterium]|nr:hypothetical protein [Candidatus Goldiibacteriota bacterium]
MIKHLVFIASYLFYIYFYLNNCNKIIYPLFLFPFVIYLLIFAFSFFDYLIKREYLGAVFQKYSKFLYLSLLFGFTPIFLKLNIPEPHNFFQRKLEIMMGSVYSIFVVVCTIKFILKFYFSYRLFNSKKIFWFLVFFFFFFYFAVSLWFNYANQPTGDEPEYILMAHSIIHDRDLDLKNNFENKDYKIFYKDKILKPQDAAIKKDGKLYSYHPFFISFLISPFYFIGQRFGVTLFLNFIASFLIGIIFLIILKIYNDTKISLITTLVTGFSMPVFSHINHVATDMMSGFILTCSFFIMAFLRHKFFLFSFLIALSIWLHPRNIPLSFIILLLFIYKNRKDLRKMIFVTLLQVFNFILFITVNKILYNKIIPSQGLEKAGESFLGGFHFDIIKSAFAFAGLFFDQEFGLFFYTPVFMLIIAGYYFLYKQKREIFYDLIFILVPFLIFISMWGEWRGGGGASPRFFISVIFTLVIPVSAIIYNFKDKFTRFIFYMLTYLGFIMSFFTFLIPWFRWNKGYGETWILKIISSFIKIDVTNFFPSLWAVNKYTFITLFFWVVLVVVLNIWTITGNKNQLTKN